jgi:hypothetical protein
MLKIDSIKYNRMRARREEGRADAREWPHASQKVLSSSSVALQNGHARIETSGIAQACGSPGIGFICFYFLANLAWCIYIMGIWNWMSTTISELQTPCFERFPDP